MRFDCDRTNKCRAVFIIRCAMLMILVLAQSPSSIYAQTQSGKADFIGIYRFSGQSNSHLEFVTRAGKLIATRVYDNPDLKKEYGERESFFEATLDGREFSGTMTFSSMDKGLPINGKISRDKRTIEWMGKDSQGIQYTSIVYKEEQEEPKVEAKAVPAVVAKAEPKVEAKAVPVAVAKEEPKVEAKAVPAVVAKAEPKVEVKALPVVVSKAEPVVVAKAEPKVEAKAVPIAVAKEEPKVEAKSVPAVVAKEEPKVASNRQFTQEVDLGFAAYKNKQYDEAISHHQKALQIDPGNKDAFKVYCALGANYFRKNLLAEALNKAQKCLELNASYGVGNGFMGDILSRRGNRTSACMYYKKGCDLGTAFSCNKYKSQCLNK
jgi:tetratricopeptide (TPR) repeat protein